MLKFSRMPVGLLALTIATPVLAQPATMPGSPAAPKAPATESQSTVAAPKADLVDINTATAAELKALPGISDSDANKIIRGRPYTDKSQLVSKKVVSAAVHHKIKDHVVVSSIRALGKTVGELPKGKIYLQAPIEMKVGDKRTVIARVGLNVADEVLSGHAGAGNWSTEEPLSVSHEMVATLTGPGFQIIPTTPEKQTVAEGFPTVWEWEIEAKQAGTEDVEATLYALLPDNASGTAWQRVGSPTHPISVTVMPQTWVEWLRSVSEEIGAVKASLGTLVAVVLGWFGVSRRRQRNRAWTAARAPKPKRAKVGGGGEHRAA